MMEAELTTKPQEFNKKVYDLLLEASLEANYEKMPLSWAPWL